VGSSRCGRGLEAAVTRAFNMRPWRNNDAMAPLPA
jgi:hypothetical protein